MDIINLLPENIANQIAAGEVIQRPASVVKETLENSIDSGANEIQLIIKDSGKTLIQIIDNGCGMSSNDVEKCFLRHATSKIKKVDDLFEILTMGFRGEAMASIASIAHIELETKLHDEELGTKIIIEGGKIKSKTDQNCAVGTSIKIKNIFFNIPARRKFLKSDNVEMRHIIEEFNRIALANPSCKLQLFHDDKEIFYLDDLIADFRIQEVQKAGAVFDTAKLDWINNHHLAALSFDDFKDRLIPFLNSVEIDLTQKKNSNEIIEAMRSSKPTLLGVAKDLIPYFFQVNSYDEKAASKFLIGSEPVLEYVQRKLNKLEAWNEESIDHALQEAQTELSLPTPKLNQPIRIAMTGSTQSPSLGLTLSLFDLVEVNNRIDAALKYLAHST